MKVINVKNSKCTHYCGRPSSYNGNGEDFSILGNPYITIPGIRSRGASIKSYREYLSYERVKNSTVWKALVSLPADATLGCFCKPLACHCDVIVEMWVEDAYSTFNNALK